MPVLRIDRGEALWKVVTTPLKNECCEQINGGDSTEETKVIGNRDFRASEIGKAEAEILCPRQDNTLQLLLPLSKLSHEPNL